jgi:glutamyl/glutaminyl-tRNA synthetase
VERALARRRLWLRIEDLDRSRVKPGMVDDCLRDLDGWGSTGRGAAPHRGRLALRRGARAAPREWRRLSVHVLAADLELALGATACGGRRAALSGTCRGASRRPKRRTPEQLAVECASAFLTVELEIHDGIAGDVRVDVQREVGDFLLARRDGASPTTRVVVDDAYMA